MRPPTSSATRSFIRHVAAFVLCAASACTGEDDLAIDRDGSSPVEGAPTVALDEPLESYEITYRIERVVDDRVEETTARLLVERPYRSRFETGDLVRVADFGSFGEREPGDETEVTAPVPAPAPGDVRADVLPLAEPVEQREVLGRRCTVYTLGASLLQGTFATDLDNVDVCIDGDGLVLEEVVSGEDGAIHERRVAVEVDTTPDVDDVAFDLDGVRPRPAEEGGGSVLEVERSSSPPGLFWALDAPPAGFEHRGRYATVPPQRARLDEEQTRPGFVAGITDVYEHGIDVIVVEQGGTLGQIPPFGDHPHGEIVDDLGEVASRGELVQHPYGAELRILLPLGKFVKVSGTVERGVLVELARALHAVEGTELVYLNPPDSSGG